MLRVYSLAHQPHLLRYGQPRFWYVHNRLSHRVQRYELISEIAKYFDDYFWYKQSKKGLYLWKELTDGQHIIWILIILVSKVPRSCVTIKNPDLPDLSDKHDNHFIIHVPHVVLAANGLKAQRAHSHINSKQKTGTRGFAPILFKGFFWFLSFLMALMDTGSPRKSCACRRRQKHKKPLVLDAICLLRAIDAAAVWKSLSKLRYLLPAASSPWQGFASITRR